MVTTKSQVKYSYFKSKEFFEKINSLLDQGYLIFNEDKELLNSNYRFEFNEPPWTKEFDDHCWFQEIMFDHCGYFDPDRTWTDTKKIYQQWICIHPKDRIKIL